MGTVMKWRIPTAIAAAMAAFLTPATPSAVANSAAERTAAVCGQRAELVAGFAQEFGEVPVVSAMTDRGHAMEVLASPGGTWTIVITSPGGPSCAIATGQEWEPVKPDTTLTADRPV